MFGVATTLILICALLMHSESNAQQSADSFTEKPFVQGNILFGAHRGGRHWRPESTLKSYQESAARWPHIMLEGDVHLTKDGIPVLLHDATVDRTTNGSGPIGDLTLDEVKALDAGYRFTRDKGQTFPYRGKGYTISTLREVLTAITTHQFMIELKDQEGIAAPTVAVIQETGAVDRVALASFNATLMEEAKALEPRIPTCYSARTLLKLANTLRSKNWDKYVPEDDLLVMNYHTLSRYLMTEADFPAIQAKGIRICLYNINAPAEIRKLLDMKIDSMLTDKPDVFSEVLDAWQTDTADKQ